MIPPGYLWIYYNTLSKNFNNFFQFVFLFLCICYQKYRLAFVLTFGAENDKIAYASGELSERFKEPVLKTGDSERNLGFESLTLRQKSSYPQSGMRIFNAERDSKGR